MLTAEQARKQADEYIADLQRKNEKERMETKAKEYNRIETLWRRRREELVSTIEGYITKAAAKGEYRIWEPTTINPNGDDILYLKETDQDLKEKLMQYFREKGFRVGDYEYGGLKITWERN